jgi:hypothetical protein
MLPYRAVNIMGGNMEATAEKCIPFAQDLRSCPKCKARHCRLLFKDGQSLCIRCEASDFAANRRLLRVYQKALAEYRLKRETKAFLLKHGVELPRKQTLRTLWLSFMDWRSKQDIRALDGEVSPIKRVLRPAPQAV